ncbi:MAG: hypothetical protein ACJARO_001963 [Bacteriovoracaceae bacterium]|jgi:hypothetical protein
MVFLETPRSLCPDESKGKVVLSEKIFCSAKALEAKAIKTIIKSDVFKAIPSFSSV